MIEGKVVINGSIRTQHGFLLLPSKTISSLVEKRQSFPPHMFLRQISTIKSHDVGKEGYFGNHKVISYHLQLTRGAQPPGQLSL